MTGETAIITVSEVEQEALSSTQVPSDEGIATERAIEEAQARIAGYLRRPVMIHETTEGIERWLKDELRENYWRYRTKAWPIVQVQSDEYSIRHDDRHLTRDTRRKETVTYFAGWKRRRQSLSDLPTGGGEALDGLTTEPPTVPSDIRRVALKLTLHELIQTEEGVGIQTLTEATAGGTTTVNGPDPQTPMRLLDSISHYRSDPF